MDTFDCIGTKLESTEYSEKHVPNDVKKVLEAARLTASGINSQHWRFVLVQDPALIKKVADDSATGRWVASADFPSLCSRTRSTSFTSLTRAGRYRTCNSLRGTTASLPASSLASREKMTRDFALPAEPSLTAVMGFGYPAKRLSGKKNRMPIGEVAFLNRYGQKLTL